MKAKLFQLFKQKVAKEAKHYPSLKKLQGQFNEQFLLAAFNAKQTPTQCCNSMTEAV